MIFVPQQILCKNKKMSPAYRSYEGKEKLIVGLVGKPEANGSF
jgi:hypothetical protein